MIRRTSIVVFSILSLVLFSGFVSAQVLTPPEVENKQKLTAVSFDGIVESSKKYSFFVKSVSQSYQVKLVPNAEIVLRLNKPNFDFAKGEVKVQRTVLNLATEQSGEDLKPGRIVYRLPATLFMKASFETNRQMQRIMLAPVKRINNYQMSPTGFGAQLPSEKSKLISGQVIPNENGDVKLVVEKEEFPVMFGHRGGSLAGFTILELKPQATEVFVWGNVGEDNIVMADRVEFRPVVSSQELAEAKTADNQQNSK